MINTGYARRSSHEVAFGRGFDLWVAYGGNIVWKNEAYIGETYARMGMATPRGEGSKPEAL